MLKFFRSIRQNLLSNGKNGKYFKYAIGEIALVMIGILLALQVNNWNENLKIKKQQTITLKSIKQDLEADAIYLKDYIKQIETSNQILINQSDRVNQSSFNKDSLIHFMKNEINIFMVSFNGFNNNSYESIKTSGKFDLLNGPFKEPLFELSILQQKAQEVFLALRDDYFDEIEALNENYPISASFSFIKKGNKYDFIWNDIDEKDLLLRLNSWGTGKANFYRNITRNFIEILDKTESILSLIEDTND